MRTGLVVAGVLAGAASLAVAGSAARPRLTLRATPRIALCPAGVYVVAELQGGGDVERFHCPAVEWDWDDGNRSTHESDCEPFQEGTAIERRFSARHVYRGPGVYNVRLTLRRAGRALAASVVTIDVRGHVGPDD